MSDLYQSLVERICDAVHDLDHIVERAGQSWTMVQRSSAEQFAYVDSVALNLHGFYSGLERLFELIARHVDRKLPKGETWHRDLLRQMAEDLPDTRPAVISPENATTIDEFRRFRHLVRNVYTIDLAPEKIAGLMKTLPEMWSQLRAELLAFADFLNELDT